MPHDCSTATRPQHGDLQCSASAQVGIDARSLDDLTLGGIRELHVAELSGASSSGKTAICLTIAATVLLSGGYVLYIDAFSNVQPSRLEAMLRSRCEACSGTRCFFAACRRRPLTYPA